MRLLTNVTSLLSLNAGIESRTTNNLSSNSNASLHSPRTPLNETVYTRVRQISELFALASFRELQATSTFGPTTNPELLLDVRLFFSWGHRTLCVEMTSIWGKWEPPRALMRPWPPGYNVLQSRLNMDIVFADELIKKAGYIGPYEAVDVQWPKGLPLGMEQSYYRFLMEGNRPDFVYVGVNDQRVMTSLPGVGEDVGEDGLTIM